MNSTTEFKVKFVIDSEDRYTALVSAYDRIRECKSADAWPEKEEDWSPFFDAKALSYFWWPTDADLEDWNQRYFSTPVPQRFTDPSLQHPWDFLSMFDAFKNGDYALLPIEQISSSEGALVFDPFGFPFGGTGCRRALIESFDHRVTHDDGALEGTPKRWWQFWKR